MPAPVTPLIGCDVFVADATKTKVLLIRRADNGFWALPGGFHDIGETPKQCAERECHEETGLVVRCTRLIGLFSSRCYPEINYPHKGGHYCHVLFLAESIDGSVRPTNEAKEIGWFGEHDIPPLSDGHAPRIVVGFQALRVSAFVTHFE